MERRIKGDLIKRVYVRDDEILYRQFLAGAEGHLQESLDRAYQELKDSRAETQAASNHALVALVVLACVYFGVIESLESAGLRISQSSVLHFALLASAALSFRSAYLQTRVTFIRALFEAHSKRLTQSAKADWLARYPLGYNAVNFYSPIFGWPTYLIPLHKKFVFELVEVLFIAFGAVGFVFATLWIVVGTCWRILSDGDLSLFSVLTVFTSVSLYLGSAFFPKYGSKRRGYRHMGLIQLFTRVKNKPQSDRYLEMLVRAQINMGGDPEVASNPPGRQEHGN